MKTVQFTMFLFYRYYKSGRWESVPYFHTLCSMSLLLFLHIAALLCFLDKGDLLFGKDKNIFILKILTLFALSFVAFWKLANEKDLEAAEYNEVTIRKGNRLLVLYLILSFAVLVLSIVK